MSSLESRILACAEYIVDHYDKTLTLVELSSRFAISQFHLQRQFSDLLGITPKKFQLALRINALKKSLKNGEEITDAIYKSGFGSSSRVYENIDTTIGMTLSAYKSGGQSENISFAFRDTIVGKIIMGATDRGVCFVHIGDSYPELLYSLHKEFPSANLCATPESSFDDLDHWIQSLDNHLKHNKELPDIPLDLKGTLFQIRVWKFLTSLKVGDRTTYGELANSIGQPTAYRAVANACAANNIAILIPCHRVLRGNGKSGGYRWGADCKEKLLLLERYNNEI